MDPFISKSTSEPSGPSTQNLNGKLVDFGRTKTCFTLICRFINTPVKRQYINALFQMAVNHRKRVATFINFLSFISIDIQGFSFNFGRKILTGFEMKELEN